MPLETSLNYCSVMAERLLPESAVLSTKLQKIGTHSIPLGGWHHWLFLCCAGERQMHGNHNGYRQESQTP
ncbi:hypothetical protein CCR75_003070 [Bremia lactucae]|uniref:Uncharacterized protein n=1 Tax=Bremia lactucae TaxID=4779 RepID=A0A976IM65_BRELC|nr:hypothetical protein CCR75_003070 [Bremia lactucae]